MAVNLKPDTEALLRQEAQRRGQDADTLVRDLLGQARAEVEAHREQALQGLLNLVNRGLNFGGERFNRAEFYEDQENERGMQREPSSKAGVE